VSIFRALLFAAFTMVLLAQQPIRVSTRLVQVNVVVRDGKGPISGLTRDDFKIFDKGKERPLAVFTAVGSDSAAPAVVVHPDAKKPEPLPPGVFTNRVESKNNSAVSATVLLIDMLNTDVMDQQAARKHVLEFLASMDSTRRVAIYTLNEKLRVLQDFTDDPALLQKAVMKYQGQSAGMLRGSNSQAPKVNDNLAVADKTGMADPTIAMMRESFNEMHDFHQVNRAAATLGALAQIGAHLAHVPGRKTLIWLSGSFPFYLINDERGNFMAAGRENLNFQDEINRAVKALSAADIAIYPVDGRGLLGMPGWDPSNPSDAIGVPRAGRTRDQQRSGMFGKRGNGQLGIMPVDTPEGIETMNDLAAGTGGRAFYNTNDLKTAIASAMDDAEVSYTLGFYAPDTPDETFHDIKVKVDRAGIETRHRKGYFFGKEKVPAEKDRMAIVREAAATALDATAIGLMAGIERVAEPRPGSFHIALKLNLQDFSLENRDGKWKGAADVAFVSQALDGKPLDVASKTVTFDLTDEAYQARLRDGVFLEHVVEPNAKLNRIRVVVLDHQSAALGSISLSPK
jgi:VWFA-related protein